MFRNQWKWALSACLSAVLGLLALPLLPVFAAAQHAPRVAPARDWVLTWADEFNGPDGSAPDPAKWTIITAGHGFGNNELQYYTARPENLHIENGMLVMTARKESFTGVEGVTRAYTSARLQTKGDFEQKYGRMEARIKIPDGGRGIWPAFWMMGSDFDSIGWPRCGEVDIMENIGSEPGSVHGTLHGPGYSGATPLTGTYTLPGNVHVGADFHRFAAEWEPGVIRFYIDDTLFETWSADKIPGKHWAFDHPFYLLLDLAVGGNWPGAPDEHTVFPSQMLVDYVRVYRRGKPAGHGQN
jgi:beta-glucanase (GH16 family)